MQALTAILLWVGVVTLTFGAWLTHVITCLVAGSWGLLIAGAIMFPIGIIHGWLIWLGLM